MARSTHTTAPVSYVFASGRDAGPLLLVADAQAYDLLPDCDRPVLRYFRYGTVGL